LRSKTLKTTGARLDRSRLAAISRAPAQAGWIAAREKMSPRRDNVASSDV